MTVAPTAGRKERVFDSARRAHPFIDELVEMSRRRDLVLLWTSRNLKLRYKRSILGVLWTLLEPLMLMAVLTVVFGVAFKFPLENYPIYVLCGLLLFDFVSRSTTQITEEVIAADSLAKRIHLPRSVFAVATVLSYLVNWAIAMVPLLVIMLVLGQPLSWSLLTVPAGMLLAALFALGLGLVVATVSTFFHDAKLAYNVILVAWFYSTPIIYPIEIVPAKWAAYLRLNPLYLLARLVRDPVFEGRSATLSDWAMGTGVGVGVAIAGWWIFSRWRDAYNYRT